MEYMDILAFVIAIAASIYLFYITTRTAKELKRGFLLLGVGVLLGLGLHASTGFLVSIGWFKFEIFMKAMSLLILTGSILILMGSYTIYHVIKSVRGDKNF